MDRILQHLALITAEITDEDLARQHEQTTIIARYLRALGMGVQLSAPDNGPAATLIEAADILESWEPLTDPAVVRDLRVSEARRCMSVADSWCRAEPPDDTFSRPHWSLLKLLAEGAVGAVRSDQARRALLRVIRLAERKTSVPRQARSKRTTLVVVGDLVHDDEIKTE